MRKNIKIDEIITKESLYASGGLASNMIEHNGDLFVAYDRVMFRLRRGAEKWEQMIFQHAEVAPDVAAPERAYRELKAVMNRFLNLSPNHPHTLGGCFEVALRNKENHEMIAVKFAQHMAIILDGVFSEVA